MKEYWIIFRTPQYRFEFGIEAENEIEAIRQLRSNQLKTVGEWCTVIDGENGKKFFVPDQLFSQSLIEVRPVPEVPF